MSGVACLAAAAPARAEASFGVSALEPAAPSGSSVRDVAVGDLDGKDGPDIVTSYSAGGLSINLNNGNGTFGPPHLYSTGCDTAQVELPDLGGTNNDNVPDGHLDAAVVCNYQGNAHETGPTSQRTFASYPLGRLNRGRSCEQLHGAWPQGRKRCRAWRGGRLGRGFASCWCGSTCERA